MLYTYVLIIVYVRHFNTKVESQDLMPSRRLYIEPSACVCVYLKRIVYHS